MNINWERWIFASITKHLSTALEEDGVNIFIEGQERQSGIVYQYEVRLDGPIIVPTTKNNYKITLVMSITVQTQMSDDYHQHHRNIGKAQGAFTPIVLYKYGDGPDDDSESFGCLKLGNEVRTRNFGQAAPGLRVEQAYVECQYETFLEE